MSRASTLALLALAATLAGCRGVPPSAQETSTRGQVEFGLVVEEERLDEVTADAYPHWDSGGEWAVPEEAIWLLERPLLRCRVARLARAVDDLGFPALEVTLHPEDARVFQVFTARAVGRKLAVLADGHVVMAPRIAEPLPGTIRLDGHFSGRDVSRLFAHLSPD